MGVFLCGEYIIDYSSYYQFGEDDQYKLDEVFCQLHITGRLGKVVEVAVGGSVVNGAVPTS